MWTKIKRSEEGLEDASKSQGIQEVASQLAQKLAQIAATEADFRQELSVSLGQFDIGSFWNALGDLQRIVLYAVAPIDSPGEVCAADCLSESFSG